MDIERVRNFYEASYSSQGFAAQRKYPNEELCRFIGRNFSRFTQQERQAMRLLEVGCGSGANLWMLAREGFATYGIDLSQESLALAERMLQSYDVQASLSPGDMTDLAFEDGFFHAVVDVFSSYCLDAQHGRAFLSSVSRVLARGGLFFSYFPAKSSEAFTHHKPASLLDEDTLSGVYRVDSPFAGNHYPFRFLHPLEYEQMLVEAGFEVQYSEVVSRTYGQRREQFSFITIEARKVA
jgi:ubiquinone/menaquinone biosynthesis C-methylase UbiE